MTRKQKRLAVIGGGVGFIAIAVLLVLFALSRSVSYFFMPSDFAENPVSKSNSTIDIAMGAT